MLIVVTASGLTEQLSEDYYCHSGLPANPIWSDLFPFLQTSWEDDSNSVRGAARKPLNRMSGWILRWVEGLLAGIISITGESTISCRVRPERRRRCSATNRGKVANNAQAAIAIANGRKLLF